MSDRTTTLNGKFDPHCGLCGARVYGLWMSDEPPPAGCTDGRDDAPWTCGHVLATLTMAVMRLDYLGAKLLPHHQQAIAVVGEQRAAEIMAHVREHRKAPTAGKPKEPNYARPAIN